MKRYNYWNYVKTGGWEIDYNFLYNKKNVCVNHHSHPAYSIFYHPMDHGRYKKIWYFQRNGKLETHNIIKDYSNPEKILEDSYPAHKKHQWFYESPFISSRGDYNMKIWGRDNIDDTPTIFYECYKNICAAHINNNPHIMMGYYGSLGTDDNITHDMENLSPPCPPSPADGLISYPVGHRTTKLTQLMPCDRSSVRDRRGDCQRLLPPARRDARNAVLREPDSALLPGPSPIGAARGVDGGTRGACRRPLPGPAVCFNLRAPVHGRAGSGLFDKPAALAASYS